MRLVVQKKGFLTDAMSDYYDAFVQVDKSTGFVAPWDMSTDNAGVTAPASTPDATSQGASSYEVEDVEEGERFGDVEEGKPRYVELEPVRYFLKRPEQDLSKLPYVHKDRRRPNPDRWRRLYRDTKTDQVVYGSKPDQSDLKGQRWKNLRKDQLIVDDDGKPSSIVPPTTISDQELVAITKQLTEDEEDSQSSELWQYAVCW